MYGLPVNHTALQERGSAVPPFFFDKNLRLKFQSFDTIDLATALIGMANGAVLSHKELVMSTVFSDTQALINALNTLLDIKFITRHDQIEIYEFAETDTVEVVDYVEFDLGLVKHETGLPNVVLSKYRVMRDTTLTKLKSYAGKELKSRTWNVAGEITDDDGVVTPVKKEKPKPFTQFSDVLEEICPYLSEEEREEAFRACVKTVKKDYYGEDSWREYCFYSVRMGEVEHTLDRLGHLRPYLRKIRLNALLEVINS